MIFIYRINSDDAFRVSGAKRIINLNDNKSFSYTFWNDLTKYETWYDTKALDLLYISLAVFASDRLVSRSDADDSWSRDFEIYIPVINLELWNSNKDLLEKILSFLSGDNWEFRFRERTLTEKEKKHNEKFNNSKKEVLKYSQVCMFSGGLDSFVGLIDILESDMKTDTLFVSHYGGGKGTKEYQDSLKNAFCEYYNCSQKDFHQFYAKVVGGKEDTTRTRSFMFFSHAIAIASALNDNVDLIIPENGLISLNIPSTLSRLGTSSTRTTHPYYLGLFQQLLNNLGLLITLKNPYQFKTKGEMLLECKNQSFMIAHINETMSCSHPDNGRHHKEGQTMHCGYCLPCVIRQAAIKKANIEDTNQYRDNKFEKMKVAKESINSYKLGLKRFKPQYAFMSIQQSGNITNHIDKYASLYVRGMQELKEYLEDL